jgi:hypothetical protein
MSKSLNDLASDIHIENCQKGFYDEERQPLEFHMLIVSEIAEATEEVRRGAPDKWNRDDPNGKPEGEAVEMADALIRILDYMAYRGWDIDAIVEEKLAYNRTRPYKHGKKL